MASSLKHLDILCVIGRTPSESIEGSLLANCAVPPSGARLTLVSILNVPQVFVLPQKVKRGSKLPAMPVRDSVLLV